MFKKKGLPEEGELVLCTVKKIEPHSAFVTLDEYDVNEGMLHISEVALKGVKNIKDYLSVGKKIVCKVMRVKGNDIDVSLKRVNSGARKAKLNEVKIEKRLYHLIEHACNEAGKPEQTKNVIEQLINKHGSLINIHEALRKEGLRILEGISIPQEIMKPLRRDLESLLNQLSVSIKRELIITSREGDGVERIKKTITNIKTPTNIKLMITYLGSSRFLIRIEARSYKIAEEYYNKLREEIINKAKNNNCLVEFR